MSDEILQKGLWIKRTVEETLDIYANWAEDYDKDVLGSGYITPKRCAEMLAQTVDLDAPVLDFGCGTGLSGQALIDAGFTTVDGTDISAEMLDQANAKGIYRRTWLSEAGALSITSGTFAGICATGVVSLGAAPADTLDTLISVSQSGAYLVFSFNDPTLAEGSYDAYLEGLVAAQKLEVLERAHGPHLPEKGMGSDVILARVL